MLQIYKFNFCSSIISFILVLSIGSKLCSQDEPTLGLLSKSDNASDVLTLVGSVNNNTVYLINNCGHYENKWENLESTGLGSYLTDDGDLMRVERGAGNILAGGSAGRISQYDWDGNLIWSGLVSVIDSFQAHHDLELLPNGNILTNVWELIDEEQALALGRDPTAITSSGIFAEAVYEIEPIGTEDYNIVWRWSILDHLVQNIDPTLDNFGEASDFPGRLDFNTFTNNLLSDPDYFHFNSVDYNADTDQILLSCRDFSEVYIIDHSTTIEEAASSTGGNSGKGGDILFRYGNPQMYGFGDNEDRLFYGQHDARWLKNLPEGQAGISIYNNGDNRPGNFSTVDEVIIDHDEDGLNYTFDDILGFEIATHNLAINGAEFINFESLRMSGAFKLDNGNYIVSHGREGRLQEIGQFGNIEWEYRFPVNQNGPLSQGEVTAGNSLFKTFSYTRSHPGLVAKPLIDMGPIELNPIENGCTVISSVYDIDPVQLNQVPTVWEDQIYLNNATDYQTLTIYNLQGNIVSYYHNVEQDSQITIDVSYLQKGMYILMINNTPTKCVKQ